MFNKITEIEEEKKKKKEKRCASRKTNTTIIKMNIEQTRRKMVDIKKMNT